MHTVDDAGGRRDDVQVKLPLQPLLDDLHVEQPQEAAAEPVAQRLAGLQLVGERRVVQVQLFQGVLQILVIAAVQRIDAAEDHRRHLAVTGQRALRRAGCVRDGVAHPRVVQVLDRRGDIAHLAGGKRFLRRVSRASDTDLDHIERGAGIHHPDRHARADLAFDDAHEADGALVVVII